MKPLNGDKTHPLSPHALHELRELLHAPLPTSAVNPGVINRLQRESLVEIVELPSPFPTHKGAKTPHLAITEAGRAILTSGARKYTVYIPTRLHEADLPGDILYDSSSFEHLPHTYPCAPAVISGLGVNMMSVRAKFTVTGIMDHGSQKTVHLEPRYDSTIPEDRRFFEATPWGKMEMTINNPVALEQFQIGKSFYADFTPA